MGYHKLRKEGEVVTGLEGRERKKSVMKIQVEYVLDNKVGIYWRSLESQDDFKKVIFTIHKGRDL